MHPGRSAGTFRDACRVVAQLDYIVLQLGVERVGIRELRQNASKVIEAAEGGVVYQVTNHGQDTGVTIAKHRPAEATTREGAVPDLVANSGIYDLPRPPGYEDAL